MNIEKLWDRLEPGTRQWLVDNPGCRILPRTVVAAIAKATGEELEQDRTAKPSSPPATASSSAPPPGTRTPTARRPPNLGCGGISYPVSPKTATMLPGPAYTGRRIVSVRQITDGGRGRSGSQGCRDGTCPAG
ncbi:hypothetical protein NCCP2145_21860 [Pseudarthrobacter sp. NCCP-2145]|nr:hypothetical protein NCCP2145_21860 [Pseudarthrobacter sp. NCCP-2145]